ncbi:DUF1819 family protein [Lacticaseibacillus rhamnosus]|uniref:DUF1819 family protein n=1 Tax=Lacticaseibacillus rhamnosus TaxID=47715 RepID=UPI000A890A56|nr:DUF1819 family protein [Lacticaseibacillus rhamnosus]
MKKLSAGFISRSVWFTEFSAVISLLNEGKDWDDITKAIVEENSFQMSSRNRAQDLAREMKLRISTLPVGFVDIFDQLSLSNQKSVNLIALMLERPLVEDFVLTVVQKEFFKR